MLSWIAVGGGSGIDGGTDDRIDTRNTFLIPEGLSPIPALLSVVKTLGICLEMGTASSLLSRKPVSTRKNYATGLLKYTMLAIISL